MRKSKNRYFYHIFVLPGDAPRAITLNVIWMEREFDAYKLPRWICPSNYNRFSDRARYWSKIVILSLHSTPPVKGFPTSRRNIATPFGTEKLEWLSYPTVKKFRRYLYSFSRNSRTWQTDGHRVTTYRAYRAYACASRGKNPKDKSIRKNPQSWQTSTTKSVQQPLQKDDILSLPRK